MRERNRDGDGASLPKPYDFVPLPPERSGNQFPSATGHHTVLGSGAENLLSGQLQAQIVAEAPLIVASGRVTTVDALLQHGDVAPESVGDDTIVLEHVRSRGKRIIPGTSLKGVIRSVVEAITHTGATFTPVHRDRTRRSSGREVLVTDIRNRSEQPGFSRSAAPPLLSLSARLFGITSGRNGYQGHVSISDAPQAKGGGSLFRRLPLYSPQADYSQSLPELTTRWERYFTDQRRTGFRGRKFYRAGKPREVEPPYNALEVCDPGSTFTFGLRFERITPADLGILLLALGAGGEIPRLALGGGKPLALGTIRFEGITVSLVRPERYLDFEASGEATVTDFDPYLAAARSSDDLFKDGLSALGEIARTPAAYTAGGDDRNY